jgi:hypothetical protein
MGDRARWLLLTAEGRRVLIAAYVAAALVSIVTYGIVRSPAYAVGQAVVFTLAAVWTRWCLRRGWSAR